MKNEIAQFLVSVALTIGLAVFAQAQSDSPYKVTIPFNFIVGEKTFEAGEYSISFKISNAVQNNFLLRSADGKQSAIVSYGIGNEVEKQVENSNLVFSVSGENYILREVNTPQKSIEFHKSPLKNRQKDSFKTVEAKLEK